MPEWLEKAGFARLSSAALALAMIGLLMLLAIQLKSEAGRREALPTFAANSAGSGVDGAIEARRLRAHLEQQPGDARGWAILARLQFDSDRYTEAAQAYEKALTLRSKVANDPAVWCEYADALAMTQGGKLSGRPRELIDRALSLKPNHPKALEMAGSAEYAQGDYAAALSFWRPLLLQLAPGSQAHAELAAAIARAERLELMAVPTGRR